MSATGDVLELVFGGADGPVAVCAQVSERRDVAVAERVSADVMQRVLDRPVPNLPPLVRGGIALMTISARLMSRHRSDHPDGPTGESSLSIWRDTSGRLRLERTWQSDADRLFNRQDIRETVGALILANPRDGTVAGRAVIELDARLRVPRESGLDSLPIGADDYTLAVDREYRHLLRIEARNGSHVFEVIEVTGVSYGDDIPSELFDDPKLPIDQLLRPQQR